MDQGIAALISAGVTAIIGPILVLIFQRRINEAGLPPASEERLNLLRGEWHGYFRQVISGKEENFIAEGTLINRRKIIQGELNYMGGDGKRVFLILYNGIFDGNILKVEYKNKNIHVFQYGSAVMRMNAKGNMLEGKFVGFSPSLERIISGEVRFSDGPGRLQETS